MSTIRNEGKRNVEEEEPPPYPGENENQPGDEELPPLTQPPSVYGHPHDQHAIEGFFTRAPAEQLRIQAIIMALVSCFCGAWICSIPAFVLALLPECCRNSFETSPKTFYTISILLSILAIIAGLLLLLTAWWKYSLFSVFYVIHEENSTEILTQ